MLREMQVENTVSEVVSAFTGSLEQGGGEGQGQASGGACSEMLGWQNKNRMSYSEPLQIKQFSS